MAETRDPLAPHGYDDDGVPLAPYGLKADGNPKLDGRGRLAGQKVASPKKRTPSKATTKDREKADTKATLVGLADAVTLPLVGASKSGLVARWMGEHQAMALAGDAVILDAYAPAAADVFLQFAETRPSLLTFLDTLEEQAPLISAAMLGIQITKAIVANHMKPDARLARSGLLMAQIKGAQMAEQIEKQAAEMGIPTDVHVMAEAA